MTLLYGALRASRLLALGLVALWFGATGETDAWLVAYAVASYTAGVATAAFGEAMVAQMRSASWAGLSVAAAGASAITAGVGYALAGPASFAFVPLVAFTVAASTLSGWHSAHGGASRLVIGSHSTALGAFLSVALALRSHGLSGIAVALTVSEAVRTVTLLRTPGMPLWAPLPRSALAYVLTMALFGVGAPVARVYALPLGDGQASIITYAMAGTGLLTTALGSGLMVRTGHRLSTRSAMPQALAVAPLALAVPLPALAALTALLMGRMPPFIANARMLPALVAAGQWRFLLGVSSVYALAFLGLGWIAAHVAGITAIALVLVSLEIGIAGVFKRQLRRTDAGFGHRSW